MTYFIPSTRTEIISDMLVFIPHTIPIPTITTDNFLTKAASDVTTLLTCPSSNIHSTLQIGDFIKNGLLQLETLINRNQITNKVINNQETKTNILEAAIHNHYHEDEPESITTQSTSTSF